MSLNLHKQSKACFKFKLNKLLTVLLLLLLTWFPSPGLDPSLLLYSTKEFGRSSSGKIPPFPHVSNVWQYVAGLSVLLNLWYCVRIEEIQFKLSLAACLKVSDRSMQLILSQICTQSDLVKQSEYVLLQVENIEGANEQIFRNGKCWIGTNKGFILRKCTGSGKLSSEHHIRLTVPWILYSTHLVVYP